MQYFYSPTIFEVQGNCFVFILQQVVHRFASPPVGYSCHGDRE
jgi:hypothetical protein